MRSALFAVVISSGCATAANDNARPPVHPVAVHAEFHRDAARQAIGIVNDAAGCRLVGEAREARIVIGDVVTLDQCDEWQINHYGLGGKAEGNTRFCGDGRIHILLRNVVEHPRQVAVIVHELSHALTGVRHADDGAAAASAPTAELDDETRARLRGLCK